MSNKCNAAVFMCALAMSGCSADGPMGPGGPVGTDGANGAEGAQGLPGDDGHDGQDATQPLPELDATLRWYGDNRERLQAMIEAVAPLGDQVAMFDWDNTVIKNDIGDAVTFYMLKNGLVLQPSSWDATSKYLTVPALDSLVAYCPITTPGDALDTKSTTGVPCADAILCIYYYGGVWNGTCDTNVDAFDVTAYDPLRIEPAYAWTVSLQAGHTPDEMRAIAKATIEYATYASLGEMQTVGTQSVPRFIRIYEEIEDLIDVMQKHGFDVWVVSASSQYIVEPFAHFVGIPADHVIGVRAVLDGGVLTESFEGCGDELDGNQNVISYREGKRCWINKLVFPTTYQADATDFTRPSPTAFGAGDSNTDIEFLLDASEMKLVINRNKNDLMCHAYNDVDGKWLINPMFIQPKGKYTQGYVCAPPLENQEDTVYGY